jgi:hypothetical protein
MEKTDISPKELEQVEKSFALYIERQTKKQTPEDIESHA